ncbi:MAG: urease accessory protein UreD [Thalassotalea sp.]
MNVSNSQVKLTEQSPTKNAWLADLSLEFSATSSGTQLTRAKRLGPLSVQKAFYPEGRDCAHIYLLHPPAGIVSGDELNISITTNANAHSLVTTPGANRFYRARADENIGCPKQLQTTTLTLSAKAKCENFPLETIVYDGAQGFNTVDIHLHQSSVYLGWDITCLGLPSSEKPFELGQYNQLNKVYCDDKLIYHDRIVIKAENQIQRHVAGLNQHSVFATFMAYASAQHISAETSRNLIEQLRELIAHNHAETKISITQIRQLLIMRYLGNHAEECKTLFIKMWQLIRPLYLDKLGTLPRIWHT